MINFNLSGKFSQAAFNTLRCSSENKFKASRRKMLQLIFCEQVSSRGFGEKKSNLLFKFIDTKFINHKKKFYKKNSNLIEKFLRKLSTQTIFLLITFYKQKKMNFLMHFDEFVGNYESIFLRLLKTIRAMALPCNWYDCKRCK